MLPMCVAATAAKQGGKTKSKASRDLLFTHWLIKSARWMCWWAKSSLIVLFWTLILPKSKQLFHSNFISVLIKSSSNLQLTDWLYFQSVVHSISVDSVSIEHPVSRGKKCLCELILCFTSLRLKFWFCYYVAIVAHVFLSLVARLLYSYSSLIQLCSVYCNYMT